MGPLRQRSPSPPEQQRRAGEERAEAHEAERDLGHLVLGDQRRRQVLEDLDELLGAVGRVVGPAGHVGDLLERVLVDAAGEAAEAATAAEAAAAEQPAAGLVADELLAADRVEVAAILR